MSNVVEQSNSNIMLERLKGGDDAAFGELVNSNWSKIYNRANNLLNNKQDAEEVAQDTFIKARKNIETFRGDCSLSTWLYRIATNLAHNKHWYWFRRKRSSSLSLDLSLTDEGEMTLGDTLKSEGLDPADNAVVSEMSVLLPQAIENLPLKYSQVLKLRVDKELSYDDIATQLNISVGTVKSRISRARECLREEMSKVI